MSFIGFDGYQPGELALRHHDIIMKRVGAMDYPGITNPCGEVPLAIHGGFCLIGDVVPYHALVKPDGTTREDHMQTFVRAGEEMARFLVRTNLMRSIYSKEVERTNRIGVGITGIHEYAWKRFGMTFRDMIEGGMRAESFWSSLSAAAEATIIEADSYSEWLGLRHPETVMTVKPSGTVSKLFALTEGAHLPARAFYLRWVQFTDTDPLIDEYRSRGYPVRGPLRTYQNVYIVGFPTRTELARIMPENLIVTAAEATFEEQCRWVELIEHYWLSAGDERYARRGGQVSYTLKYDPGRIDYKEFSRVMQKWMPRLRALTVMPQSDGDAHAYEYLPEEVITGEQYAELMSKIDSGGITEDVAFEHVDCASGACPVNWEGK